MYQHTGTKRNPWVVFYTHIAQLITHTTMVHITAAYLAIMLISLLAYCRAKLIKSQRVQISERSLSKKRLVKFFILMELKMSRIVGRGALNPYSEKTAAPPLLKGFSVLNCFLADKPRHSTITFVEIIGHPLTVAWPKPMQLTIPVKQIVF